MTTPFAPFAIEPEPALRITSPPALLEAIPYLLGFHPQASLVLVGLADDALVVTVRMDLPDASGPRLANAITAMVRGGAASLLAVIYADAAAGLDGFTELSSAVVRSAAAAGCPANDVLVRAGRRWRSALCPADGCCGADGHPLPDDVSAVSAAATFAGLVARSDRAALAATLEPEPAARRAQLADRLAEAERAARGATTAGPGAGQPRSAKRVAFAAARRADRLQPIGAWEAPDDAAVAALAVTLRSTAQRDAVWMAVDDGRLDGRSLWRDLAARLPSPYDAAPLFLFGWASWRHGDGALAAIAAQRTITSDPAYSAADILLAVLAHGVDPRRLPRLRRARVP